jgi:acyl-CoA thioester hydrolase
MMLHPPVTLREGRHSYAVRAYYEDTDAGGVVYHASYLRFAERARTEALRDLGVPHAEMTELHGLMFVVRRIKVDYLVPARLDDSLVVTSEVLEMRSASVTLRQTVCRADDPSHALAVLDVVLVSVRLSDQQPGRIPGRWREALLALSGA